MATSSAAVRVAPVKGARKVLEALLEQLPDVFETHVLRTLGPTERALLARVNKNLRAAVTGSGLPRAEASRQTRLKLRDFVDSVPRFAWAKANGGCPTDGRRPCCPCALVAEGGNLEVLHWVRAHDCPWDALVCAWVAGLGNLEVLKLLRANDWPWNNRICWEAAESGNLEMIHWLQAYDCLWNEGTCATIAEGGHLKALQWLRVHDCRWDENTCSSAAKEGNLEVFQWAVAKRLPVEQEHVYALSPEMGE